MSVWFAPKVEKRTATNWPRASAYVGSSSYAEINLSTAESSLQSVAVRAAVDLIASIGSELPGDVWSGTGPDKRQRPTPSYLLDPAGDGYGLEDWCYQVLESWLLRGNSYGEVLQFSTTGIPTQIQLAHPDEVTGHIDSSGAVAWSILGKSIPPGRMVHSRANPIPGRILGLSPIAYHAAKIGLDLTASQFGLQWFRDGAHPGGLLANSEGDLTPDQVTTARERFMAARRGNREPAVLGKGWTFQEIQISPEESQFLATQAFSAAECARIFGPGIAEVLGYESGGSMTYANVDSRLLHLLVLTLNKWLRRLERLVSSMLPRPQYWRLNRDALLQTTTLQRYQAHQIALTGWKTKNEVRENEDLGPLDGGDTLPGAAPPPVQAASSALRAEAVVGHQFPELTNLSVLPEGA